MRRRLSIFWKRLTSPFRGVHAFLTSEPEDRPFSETLSESVQSPSLLIEHIEAFRKHLLRALVVTAVLVAIALNFTNTIMAILAEPIGGLQNLQAIQVTENIGVFMRIGIFTGVAFAIPYIAFEYLPFCGTGPLGTCTALWIDRYPVRRLVFFHWNNILLLLLAANGIAVPSRFRRYSCPPNCEFILRFYYQPPFLDRGRL